MNNLSTPSSFVFPEKAESPVRQAPKTKAKAYLLAQQVEHDKEQSEKRK